MTQILMGGFSENLGRKLKERLRTVDVHCTERGEDVIQAVSAGEASLLVLEHRLDNPPALDVLKRIAFDSRTAELPIIYCLSEGSGAELVKRLSREFHVREVMLPPLDMHELAWKASRLLGISPDPGMDDSHVDIDAAIAEARSRFMNVVWDRVAVLEQAGTALLEQKLTVELRRSAGREAHKLAGLLGTIGFAAGSRYACEIEGMLTGEELLVESHALRLSELIIALRLDLEKTPLTATAAQDTSSDQFSLLIVENDTELVERIEAEAAARDWCVHSVEDFTSARNIILSDQPDVVLLNPHLSGEASEGLALLEEVSSRPASIPVIVLTSQDTFTDRVEVARKGGRGFLPKSSPPRQIVEAASQLASRVRAENARILAVDDDPGILAFLRSLLEPRGLRVGTLEDPLQFWEQLDVFAPDLLLLDLDMPCLSGIELCRVVRNDPRWAEMPILFLTRHDDPATVDRVFGAGADDFVPKPIVGPELLTRVFNRLEQSRLRRSIAETDPLTGVFNRAKFSRAIADFLELGRRQTQPLAFALMGLDSLKRINYRHGHTAGDAILQRLGGILREEFRSGDVLGRWNGCEFAVGMYGLSRYDGVQRFNELIKTFRSKGFKERTGEDIPLRLSAAVAEFDEDGSDLQALYTAAETALLEAQKAGGGKVVPAGWVAGGRKTTRLDVALVMKDEAQASLLTHFLDERGCRTRWFRNGKNAVRLMAGSKPAVQPRVVLIDLDVPGLDGFSLLRRMGSDGMPSRAIVLTSPAVAEGAQ
ncbi:MAG TPA: response regulator, partial [Terriglobia bacterium]|nr:response regulator [Terriglobia bacterium]